MDPQESPDPIGEDIQSSSDIVDPIGDDIQASSVIVNPIGMRLLFCQIFNNTLFVAYPFPKQELCPN